MKAVFGSLKRFWERYKEENPTIQLSVPIVGGFAANIPLSEKGKIKRTRVGVNTQDSKTPFVESRTEKLIQFYNQYELEKFIQPKFHIELTKYLSLFNWLQEVNRTDLSSIYQRIIHFLVVENRRKTLLIFKTFPNKNV